MHLVGSDGGAGSTHLLRFSCTQHGEEALHICSPGRLEHLGLFRWGHCVICDVYVRSYMCVVMPKSVKAQELMIAGCVWPWPSSNYAAHNMEGELCRVGCSFDGSTFGCSHTHKAVVGHTASVLPIMAAGTLRMLPETSLQVGRARKGCFGKPFTEVGRNIPATRFS